MTEQWFARHGLPAGRLLMRPDDDRRPVRDCKHGRLRKLSAEGTIAVIVDDDPAVVKPLTAEGSPVRLADWGPTPPPCSRPSNIDGRT